jgi:S1-C subfamily serine protease
MSITAFSELSAAAADVVATTADAIVQVHGRPRRPASGFVVAPDRVVTTSHSVEWEDHTKVRAADGRVLAAEVAGRDARADLILLRVPGLGGHAFRDADALPRTGTLGLVIGRGWSGHLRARLTTLTRIEGQVRVAGGGTLDQLLSLDVGVYPGVSGSAVILPDGTLAGIATAGLVRATSLAIGAAHLRGVVESIEKHGSVKRGFLGISSQPVRIPERQRDGRTEGVGLVVVGIGADTPADRAGLLVGDVVVGFGGTAVSEPESLLGLLTGDRIGQATPVTVLRGGRVTDVAVTIGERPSDE